MTVPVVSSTIDVAIWFFDQSRRDDIHLPAMKLQRLLWIAQGLYAAMHHGRMLMPATFVADETGPLEPTIYHLFEDGRPQIPPRKIPMEVENFLLRLWQRYGHHSAEFLNRQIKHSEPYRKAFRLGRGSLISFEDIVTHFTQPPDRKRQVATSDGRLLKKWTPTAKPTAKRASGRVGGNPLSEKR